LPLALENILTSSKDSAFISFKASLLDGYSFSISSIQNKVSSDSSMTMQILEYHSFLDLLTHDALKLAAIELMDLIN